MPLNPWQELHWYYLQEGIIGVVMERLEPPDCCHMTLTELRKYEDEIRAAFDTLWRAGVVHRDIAARNLSVNSNGRVCIFDFGCAKFSNDPGSLSTEEDKAALAALFGQAAH